MTKDKLIKELELGLKNPNVPETFKDKIRVKLEALKAEEPKENKGKEKTTDVRSLIKYKNKFNVGDIVVSKKDNSTYKVDSFVKRNADFIYTLSNEIKNNVYHIEEEDLKIKTPAKNTLSNEDILAILYNADNKGYSATKADSGGTIRSSDELTEKYANAVSKNLTGIEKGSLSEEIYDELVDGNNHLLNEFLAWNGYYNSETSKSLKKMYQGIWERGNRQAADPEIIALGAKKLKPTTATPIKKAYKKYIANREIKSVTILEAGKKVTYSGKDVLNGANFFKEGGVLTSKATYVPIRNIVEVTFEDGSKDKPRNGYHIRNGATPIMEHGGEVKEYAIKLVPLELEPLSSQLKSYTGDSLTSGDYTNESGKEYSTAPGEIIVHKASGRKFEMPEKIYDYVGGFNLVYDKNKNKIVTWEEGDLVAEVKDGKLDFANKDESIFIDKTKVESEFKKGFIPEKSNEKWAYIAIEGKLQNLYAISEDLEDDKTTNAWKNNQAKIEKFEDFLHRIERKYAVGGTVELPEGSSQHFENYYLEKGGNLKTSPDLFENYDLQPKKLKKIVDYYQNLSEEDELDYEDTAVFLKEVEAIGYTFDYGLSNEPYGLRPIGTELVEVDEEYKLGGSLLSAWKRERKYVNKSQDYETRYAKGKSRKGYSKFAKGGPIPQKGDFVKVPVGYGMYYGLIKGVIKDKQIYPQNGYEIVGIEDVLHPEQFKVISQSEFEKQKTKGTGVKTNSFLVIDDEYNDNDTLEDLIKFKEDNDLYYKYYDELKLKGYNDKAAKKEALKKLNDHLTKYENGGKVNNQFNYMMLSRLQMDCDYYLGHGNRNEKVLWAGNVDDHIDEMKKLWNNLPKDAKPEWLSMEDILDYENKMKSDKFEKGGVLKVGDEVVDFDTMKHLGKVVEVSEINLDEDDIIVETPEGKTIKLNSFNVLRKPNVKANLGASPEVKLSIEELKAKHSVSNYGKGGKTDKEDPRGANFRLAKEIRQPGERWQDAVSRATKMLK